MKSSLILAATSAMLAMASPIRGNLDKRVMKTNWVYDVVTVTVTAGDEPTAAVFIESAPTTTSAPPPPPPPPPPPAPTTSKAAPPPPPPPPPPPKTTAQPKVVTVVEPAPSKPAPATSNSGGSSSLGDYETTMLNQHNMHRGNHSVSALVWDSELAELAGVTAGSCILKHDMGRDGVSYGQNLASWGSSGDISSLATKAAASGVTDDWYNSEMENWQFYGADNPPSGASGEFLHFTQVVWKDTTSVGCKTVSCRAGTILSVPSWYTVCNYKPEGNFGGQYGKNVLKPLGQAVATVSV